MGFCDIFSQILRIICMISGVFRLMIPSDMKFVGQLAVTMKISPLISVALHKMWFTQLYVYE